MLLESQCLDSLKIKFYLDGCCGSAWKPFTLVAAIIKLSP